MPSTQTRGTRRPEQVKPCNKHNSSFWQLAALWGSCRSDFWRVVVVLKRTRVALVRFTSVRIVQRGDTRMPQGETTRDRHRQVCGATATGTGWHWYARQRCRPSLSTNKRVLSKATHNGFRTRGSNRVGKCTALSSGTFLSQNELRQSGRQTDKRERGTKGTGPVSTG